MQLRSLFAVCALVLTAVLAVDIQEDDNVLVLTESNFDAAVDANDFMLVEFYAPWCGHCKNLAPHYAKAAATMKKADPAVALAKVDVTEEKELGERFGIRGFPTLKWFRKGKYSEYDGGRTEAEIVQWVTKKSGPAAKTVSTAEQVEAVEKSADVTVFGIFDDVNSADYKTFMNAAGGIDSANFGVSTDAAIAAHFGVTAPAIVLKKQFDEPRVDYTGEITVNGITEFVKANSMPLVIEFSQKTSAQIFGGELQLHLLLFVDKASKSYQSALASLKEVATANKGRHLCVVIPSTEERVLSYFGFKAADLPAAAMVNMAGQMKKYLMKGEVNVENLEAHVEAYFAGSLKPTLKSANVPTASHDGNVRVLVGKNFNKEAIDSGKDVFVEFYAPWCGHCKSLAPKWEELAAQYSETKGLVIAKVDATENEVDVPGIEVEGFPTLYFIPGGSAPIKYTGPREVSDLSDFIRKNAKVAKFEGEEKSAHDEL